MKEETLYADVILPIAVRTCYTYSFDAVNQCVSNGMRVRVPLGAKKSYIGIVLRVHSDFNSEINYKSIIEVIDAQPIVTQSQLDLWAWISSYYLCSLGDVMKAALPGELAKNTYTPQTDILVACNDISDIKLTQKQKDLYDYVFGLCTDSEITKKQILSLYTRSVYDALIKKELLREYEKKSSRLHSIEPCHDIYKLSDAQNKALLEIKQNFADSKPVLLRGITSSGKTEIYTYLIKDVIASGKQVLYLVPEIALTTQLTNRLMQVFGDCMLVYHSKISDVQRAEIYTEIQKSNKYSVVLGVRSSVFLPFNNLGLIIVDEEHETSYKQYEPAPRYNARNVALVLAKYTAANVLLGTATPSIESYYNTQIGKYALVELLERFENLQMPDVKVIDINDAFKKNRMQKMFSWFLIEKMKNTFANNKQVILFQNRRGFSSYIECQTCSWVPKCPHCDLSLNYHKEKKRLICHYCGYSQEMPKVCPSCGKETIKDKGFGTEKVVDALNEFFEGVQVGRLDVDTTRKKQDGDTILKNFESGKTNVLVGTQMLAKGLDFANVELVGILNADNMLNYPDFRAGERTFQLLLQVAGRAGRRHNDGLVVLQTSQPENPLINAIVKNDYLGFYESQLSERRLFMYPPYCKIINIYVKHKQQSTLNFYANSLANNLRKCLKDQVLGPEEPPVPKIQQMYIKQIMLKIDNKISYQYVKEYLEKSINLIKTKNPSVICVVDVDPL